MNATLKTTPALSPQQSAVTDFVLKGRGSAIVRARAGTGKTYLIVHAVVVPIYTTRPRDGMAIMAYNKAAADELDARVKAAGIDDWKRVSVGTFHSFGFKAWRKVAPDVAVDDKKVAKIILDLADQDETSPYALASGPLNKLVSLAKQRAIGFLKQVGDAQAWYDIVDHFGIDEDLADDITVDWLVRAGMTVLNKSFSMDREVIDFDDMIIAPLVHKAKIWQWDWVIPDEAQDTNPARRALALAMMKPRWGRMMAVGDDRQAIYGFTGADADSLDLIRKAVNAKIFPLTVTYRCPKAVVAMAQTMVPDYVAHPDAPEGIVRSLPHTRETEDRQNVVRWFEGEDLKYGDAIICRNTKPLVEEAYGLIRAGIGCMVEGRDIGKGLVALATRWSSIKNLTPLREKLDDFKAKEIQKYLAKEQEEKAAQVEDKVGTIQSLIDKLLAEGKRTVADLEDAIEGMFGDSDDEHAPKVPVLMTAHRSKGREFDRVFGLGRAKYMPSSYARKPHQMIQEENLEYVSITRTKREYVDVEVR